MEKIEMGKTGDGFIDRSKVRILLCDNDSKSSEEVFKLLCKCSYQVTSVRSPRQVIDALNAEGPDIDIILSEVDLPISKGLKMLKYIMRDKELRRIPVIMMSTQDEVSIVVKCLKFGAADYLVKPLRTNELLTLWTHMWRRRRILGLAEKNILNYDFDLVVSDPSDANTTSTTLFSDDTDEKCRKCINPEADPSIHQEDQTNAAAAAASMEIAFAVSSNSLPDLPGNSERRTGAKTLPEKVAPFPKKSELRIGKSSAFFTYVKSSLPKCNSQQDSAFLKENVTKDLMMSEEKCNVSGAQLHSNSRVNVDRRAPEIQSQRRDEFQSNDTSMADSFSMERSCTPPPFPLEFSQQQMSLSISPAHTTEFSQGVMHPRNDSRHDVSSFHPNGAYPYYIPGGVMNQVVIPPSSMYQKNMSDLHSQASMIPQYSHIPRCSPHIPGMACYHCYPPLGMCLQPGQMPATHNWPSYGSSAGEGKTSQIDRREAALIKFRQKRKERCFDKKIRYVNRKSLAERRPRVRGQFVRKVNGVTVDLNGRPASTEDDYDEEEEDEYEDQVGNMDSSVDGDASVSQR